MSNKYKKIQIFFLSLVFIFSVFVFFVTFKNNVLAVDEASLWGNGIQQQVQDTTGLSATDPRIVIARAIKIILGFLGIITLCLIMYAGFIWMNSAGEPEKINKAKGILKSAVIGLIIIVSSFAIASFVLAQLLGIAGGGNGNNDTGSGVTNPGIGAIGAGVIKSVYPELGQTGVPRNTGIIVTFREAMKPETICDVLVAGKCDAGSKIKTDAIKIFKTGHEVEANALSEATVTSTDNMTFLIKPIQYLGSPSEFIDYTVKLETSILKASNQPAFNLNPFSWNFEVSNVLDLTPPKVLEFEKGGLFPTTDNEQDIVSAGSTAVAAKGQINIIGEPKIYIANSVQVSKLVPESLEATAQNLTSCASGNITVVINSNLTAKVHYEQPGLLEENSVLITNNIIPISKCGAEAELIISAGVMATGYSWKITVIAERQSDVLNIGDKVFTFVDKPVTHNLCNYYVNVTEKSNSTPNTEINLYDCSSNCYIDKKHCYAERIAGKIAQVSGVEFIATNTKDSPIVSLTAKVAGDAGNNLLVAHSNNLAFNVVAMADGEDSHSNTTISDSQDIPKNSAVQINFSEAINPIYISGEASTVKNYIRLVNNKSNILNGGACTDNDDCKSFKCVSGKCDKDYLAGTFVVSNQYRTVEFLSDNKCGVNGCGEDIYCLPGKANIRVEAMTADLFKCNNNADCLGKGEGAVTCTNNICQSNNKNYPLAATPVDGLVDLADNSFDGNRNQIADGKPKANDVYDENKKRDTDGNVFVDAEKQFLSGDSFKWSFWTTGDLDLTPPKIKATTPVVQIAPGKDNVSLIAPLEVNFNKVMLSSSLATGEIIVGADKPAPAVPVTHKLINLASKANTPIGYWVTKEDIDTAPKDGQPNETKVFINHSMFSDLTAYRAQVGSGVKDIYQNCFKPCASIDGCATGCTNTNNSCCSNTSQASAQCN